MDTTVYLSRRGEAHEVKKMTLAICPADPRAALSDSAPSPTWEPVAGKHMALGIVLMQGLRGGLFLIGEVPLYQPNFGINSTPGENLYRTYDVGP